MNPNALVWGVSIAIVLGLFVFDFYSHVRHAHVPTVRESALWSAFYVLIAFVLMAIIGFIWDWGNAGDFIAGYATEKALSIDNLFIFLLLMNNFLVPKEAQQKVLLIGIAIALIMRGIFIAAGGVLLHHFSWVFYLFGIWLFYIAVKQFLEYFNNEPPAMPTWVLSVKKYIPTSDTYRGDRWRIEENGKKLFTPMIFVVIAVGLIDLLFALDSIPAIFGITQEPYLVFMANALALLGLRQLYFLINGLLSRLKYLHIGLAIVLGFIAVKLIFHALHVNELPFINGGHGVHFIPQIPTLLSIIIIFGTLLLTAIASIFAKD